MAEDQNIDGEAAASAPDSEPISPWLSAAEFAALAQEQRARVLKYWTTLLGVNFPSVGTQPQPVLDAATRIAELAEPIFRKSADAGEASGDVGGASLDAATLAVALLGQGRWAEGTDQATRALRLSPSDDAVTLAVAHAALAWAAAAAGDREEAERRLEAAWAHASGEAVLHEIVMHAVTAEAATELGDSTVAAGRWSTALRLCEQKGAVAGASWCRSRLRSLGSVTLG